MPPGAEFAWAAFWRLHGDRPMLTTGFSAPMGATVIQPRPGRIPFQAVDRYAWRFGIAGEAFDLLLALLDALDREFLEWESERAHDRAKARSA